MIPPPNCIFSSSTANVVGIAHTIAGIRQAIKLKPASLDLVEIRVDAFSGAPEQILPLLPKIKVPLILTARDPREGGVNRLTASERRRLLKQFMPHAAVIDIELRSAEPFEPLLGEAREAGIKVILSHHDFKQTPSLKSLRDLAKRAIRFEADLLKIAVMTSTPTDLAILLGLLVDEKQIPLSVMGMGAFGRISRLLLPLAGSRLNYGFLDKPQLAGQWPALLLKKRLEELRD